MGRMDPLTDRMSKTMLSHFKLRTKLALLLGLSALAVVASILGREGFGLKRVELGLRSDFQPGDLVKR